jgi:hypothetical protein
MPHHSLKCAVGTGIAESLIFSRIHVAIGAIISKSSLHISSPDSSPTSHPSTPTWTRGWTSLGLSPYRVLLTLTAPPQITIRLSRSKRLLARVLALYSRRSPLPVTFQLNFKLTQRLLRHVENSRSRSEGMSLDRAAILSMI